MASDLNKCCFIGRLGKDVELKTISNGEQMALFSLAVGESYTNKAGEKIKNTEWVNVVCYRKLAEICHKYLGKGSQVFVSGKLNSSKYTGKDGIERIATRVVIDEMQMLGGKNESKETSQTSDSNYDGLPDIPF